jgi:hypothetical protein
VVVCEDFTDELVEMSLLFSFPKPHPVNNNAAAKTKLNHRKCFIFIRFFLSA